MLQGTERVTLRPDDGPRASTDHSQAVDDCCRLACLASLLAWEGVSGCGVGGRVAAPRRGTLPGGPPEISPEIFPAWGARYGFRFAWRAARSEGGMVAPGKANSGMRSFLPIAQLSAWQKTNATSAGTG